MLKLIQLESLLKAGGLGHSSTDIYKLFEQNRKDGKISNTNRESTIKSDGQNEGVHRSLQKAGEGNMLGQVPRMRASFFMVVRPRFFVSNLESASSGAVLRSKRGPPRHTRDQPPRHAFDRPCSIP